MNGHNKMFIFVKRKPIAGMEELINYLICLLTGCEENSLIHNAIGYTSDKNKFSEYKIVIVPSPFFDSNFYGKQHSLPILPLNEIDGIPILYGTPTVEKINNTLVVHADIFASAYFFISRYEEWIRPNCRDKHGRFEGKQSIAYQAGFLHRPIVDEYGGLLRRRLNEMGIDTPVYPTEFKKVYLTHDVDHAFLYRTCRGLAAAAWRSIKHTNTEIAKALRTFVGYIQSDPVFTFPWIMEQNSLLQKNISIDCESILFFKSLKKMALQDKPYYYLGSKDIQFLFQTAKKQNFKIGLHSSYQSGDEPALIPLEKKQLEQYTHETIYYNRHHFLRSKEPLDMEYLIQAGITDDFTMGYADVSGFRLGTCRAVKWINLSTKKVSNLLLHPLTMMDVSLSEAKYMNLNEEEAFRYATALIDEVKKQHGELILLWHNSSFVEGNGLYHKNLYVALLNYINNLQKNG